jgi:hypothetical protein
MPSHRLEEYDQYLEHGDTDAGIDSCQGHPLEYTRHLPSKLPTGRAGQPTPSYIDRNTIRTGVTRATDSPHRVSKPIFMILITLSQPLSRVIHLPQLTDFANMI